jgi:hypothetical protein
MSLSQRAAREGEEARKYFEYQVHYSNFLRQWFFTGELEDNCSVKNAVRRFPTMPPFVTNVEPP